jgi:uncharacterized protein (TIGR03000 family)
MYSVVMMLALGGGVETADYVRRGGAGYRGYAYYGYYPSAYWPSAYWGCCGCYGYYVYPLPPVAPAAPGSMTYYPSAPASTPAQSVEQTQFVNLQDKNGDAARAVILVTAPPAARLTFNGWTAAADTGTRRFRSPPLEAGKAYTYTLQAELARDGRSLVQTYQVVVRAGQETSVPVQFPGVSVSPR